MQRIHWTFGFVVALAVACAPTSPPAPQKAAQPVAAAQPGDTKSARTDAPMFGGTPQRNMINTIDKNVPVLWSTEEGKLKNIKWIAELGSKAFGGPVIANGKVYVG